MPTVRTKFEVDDLKDLLAHLGQEEITGSELMKIMAARLVVKADEMATTGKDFVVNGEYSLDLNLTTPRLLMDDRVRVSTIAPYGPGISLTTFKDQSGEVTFDDQVYPYTSKQDLLDRSAELPFGVSLIRLWPDADFWQVGVGSVEKNLNSTR